MDVLEISEGIQLLKLRPGDKLLVRVPEEVPEETVVEHSRHLQKLWPDVPTVWFVGNIEVSILRKED